MDFIVYRRQVSFFNAIYDAFRLSFDQRWLVLSVIELLAKNNLSNWENIFFQLER